MITTCSAPGKIYLFGEHAVVYGKRVIASAINLRTTATVSEKAQHDKPVALADNMLELQKRSHETRMKQDKELYERQIKIVDAQIDGLVCDLYGLAEEGIKVVEKSL